MKTLIVHIEHEDAAGSLLAITSWELRQRLDIALRRIQEEHEDFGWRYFDNVEEAKAWEDGAALCSPGRYAEGHPQ